MKPQNQATVRSSETGLVFRMNRAVAERHDTLTILDDSRPAGEDDHQIPAAGTEADESAAFVADDNN